MRYLLYILTILIILIFSQIVKAQKHNDSSLFLNKIMDNNLSQIGLVSLPLFVQGVKMSGEKIDFSNYRRIHCPNFHTSIDNYTQYFPLALTFGLKLSGVKSQSSWKKLFILSFLSYILDYSVVTTMKNNIYSKRPDISGNNSFPSGHTSFAFMNAHIFVKEYAQDNYLYSSLAYSMATFTGAMRVMNNRHWMSDVLAGASIGLFSSELAYCLGDLLFTRERQIKKYFDYSTKNSCFVGINTSYNISFNEYDLSENRKIKFLNGATTGLHGGWFYNKYLGSGISADYSNYRYYYPEGWVRHDLSFYYVGLNQYFSLPLFSRVLLGTNLSVGYTYAEHYKRFPVKISRQDNIRYEIGANLTLLLSAHTSLRLFAKYTRTKLNIEQDRYPFQTLNIGNSISLTF